MASVEGLGNAGWKVSPQGSLCQTNHQDTHLEGPIPRQLWHEFPEQTQSCHLVSHDETTATSTKTHRGFLQSDPAAKWQVEEVEEDSQGYTSQEQPNKSAYSC